MRADHAASTRAFRKGGGVEVWSNRKLFQNFEKKRSELINAGSDGKSIWVFHGTDEKNIVPIMTGGFKIGGQNIAVANGTVYGQGVYCATGPDTPMSYGGGKVVILAEALPGKHGNNSTQTVNSWTPPSKKDWMIFRESCQLTPRYVVYIGRSPPAS
mmetsp:Transcript_20504/g.33294  ORF Transcript_20504/g.33294 Transcript_20504/m.33294 type:complete len:157 (-) Transcript_20504:94-564(-)